MTFEPVIDRNSKTKILFIESDQQEVFGNFSGTVMLDDGTRLLVKKVLDSLRK